MKTSLPLVFAFVAVWLFSYGQVSQKALFYCVDHNTKILYYSAGKATVKKHLRDKEYYQYGFMKRMGWINRSWEGLEYDIKLLPANDNSSLAKQADSLKHLYRSKGFKIENVPMPFPMKPFTGYKKDGSN